MKHKRASTTNTEKTGALKALQRAAKKALELGVRTGTPVWVMDDDGKIIDLAKNASRSKKNGTRATGVVRRTSSSSPRKEK